MENTIKDPYEVNHRIYRVISIIAILGIIISSINLCPDYEIFFEIIKNISYGCLASTIVAWLLEVYNVRDKNQKANSLYNAVFSDLKFRIQKYIEIWSEICVIAYEEDTNEEELHTWLEWYELSKSLFYKCDEKRQKEIMAFFIPRLQYVVEETNKAIQKIITQNYILTINDVYNNELRRIVEDYHFEFYAASLELKHDNSYGEFWRSMDAINSDLVRYINAWIDIKFYNAVRFKPYRFFDDEEEILRAVLDVGQSRGTYSEHNSYSIIFMIRKIWRRLLLKIWKVGKYIFIAIMIPLIIDWFVFANTFPSNISNEAWAGFLGSYIGGLCTMAAVFITINDNNIKLKEQREIKETQEKEQKRLNIKPYLDTRYTYFDYDIKLGPNDRVFDIENEHTQRVHFDINSTRRKQIEVTNRREFSRELYINYIIRNVGAGSAVDMIVSVNNFEEPLAIAKDETVQILCIVTILDDTSSDLKIKLDFSDVENRGRYSKEEIIHIEVNQNNELVSKMEKRGEQKLIT